MASDETHHVVAQQTDAKCPECGAPGQVIDPHATVKEWRCSKCGHWFAGT